uniref:HTH OST-type domain-containing protein n=1 Tax=Kalanchoe fedtschenkoi TaxID=63787 RepID=A0A7N0ZXM2_KALFE
MEAVLCGRRLLLVSTRRRIARFSTYQWRRQEDEVRNVRVSVWWDLETCNLPLAANAYRIPHNITAALRANGIRGPLHISAFGNVFKLPKTTQDALSSTGITLSHIPSGGTNSVDRSLIVELMCWVSQHPPPAHLFLISGDHDMATILHRLRMSNYNILLAAPDDASTALCAAATIMWQWNHLVNGENFAGKHFNQPPDGPNGSWYGTYRVPLENPFPTLTQPTPTIDSEPAESEPENTTCQIPTEVTEQIRHILSTYPEGLSIAVLGAELNSSMILDKRLYGHKKFSSFLLAMPQILELHQRKDGQHLVRGVNPKTHLSADPPRKSSESFNVGDSNHNKPPTQRQVHDGRSPLKSAGERSTLNSPLASNDEKSKLIEPLDSHIGDSVEHPSPATCFEKPSLKVEYHCPSTNKMDIEAAHSFPSAGVKKQDNASVDGIFQRTWIKWFGANNDGAIMREGNHSVPQVPSFDSTPARGTAPEEKPGTSTNFDREGGKIHNLCNRVINWFKTDGPETEPATTRSYTSDISSQMAQHSFKNNAFSKDDFWAEVRSFMCTPEGADVVSKSVSRLEMAQVMKNEGPPVLNSLGYDDLVHLVNVLIDDKKWIKECPSQASPFRVVCTSVSFRENSDDANVLRSKLLDKPLQRDLQKQVECGRASTSQSSAPIANTKLLEKRKTKMLGDCQKLLDEIVKSHPNGYNIGAFKKLFFDRYCYRLDVQSLEFDRLASLIHTMSGVRLVGTFIFPSENSSSAATGSSDADPQEIFNKVSIHTDSDNELSDPSTNSDNSDSQFDEQLGPVRSSKRNVPFSPSQTRKPITDKKEPHFYEPCAEEDIYTDSDGETAAIKKHAKGGVLKVHNEVSTLLDILTNWEANKEERAVKDGKLESPVKLNFPGEVIMKSTRTVVPKSKPQKTFNFISEDHRKEVLDVKSHTESRQQY